MAQRGKRQRLEREAENPNSAARRAAPDAGAPDLMGLQRAAGNQVVTHLLGTAGARPPAAGDLRVQRKAAIGRGKGPFKPVSESDDPEAQELIDDPETRRFNDEAELKSYAKDPVDKNMGLLPGPVGSQIWIRIDEKFVVLGEKHGYQIAPQIIAALRTKRYRYEGEIHRSAAREKADPGMAAFFAAKSKSKEEAFEDEQAGEAKGDAVAEERTHAAEHVLSYYARVLPEVISLADEAAKKALAAAPAVESKEEGLAAAGLELEVKEEHPAAAAPEREMKEEEAPAPAPTKRSKRHVPRRRDRRERDPESTYSLEGAAVSGLLPALLYARSYQGKRFGHPLKTFAKTHLKELNAAIDALEKGAPDLLVVHRWAPWLIELRDAYTDAALKKLGLAESSFGVARIPDQPAKSGKLYNWKKSLEGVVDPKQGEGEGQVTLDPRAKEADYLRDKSMLETIKQSKKSGDVLFVIGDAHLKKLSGKLRTAQISHYLQWDFIDKEVALNDSTLDPTDSDANYLLDHRDDYLPSEWGVGKQTTVPDEGLTTPGAFTWRIRYGDFDGTFKLGKSHFIHKKWKNEKVRVDVLKGDDVLMWREYTLI